MPLANKAFADLITFTRASAARYFDANGVMQSASNNVPRFDYDPVALTPRGLLIEEQRTNSIRNNTMQGAVAGSPGTLPTNWQVVVPAGLSVSVAGVGVESAINYVDLSVTGTASAVGQVFVGSESITQVVAAAGQSWAAAWYLSLLSGSLSSAGLTSQRIDITGRDAVGGTLETTSQAYTPVTGSLSNQRAQVARTLSNASTVRVHTAFRIDVASGSTVSFTLRIGMPQLEQGAFATSAIATSGTAATRSADVATVNTLSPWFNAAEGTFYFEGSSLNPNSTLVATDDGTTSNRLISRLNADRPQFSVITGGTEVSSLATAITNGATFKSAAAYKSNDIAICRNGATPVTSSSVAIPSGQTTVRIGSNVAGVSQPSGHIRRITYYPRRLSNAELQSITA